MNGTYSEELKTGGKIKVTKNGWGIEYYFPGPDFRYKGTFVTIQGDKVSEYMDAWIENFTEYTELKKVIPFDGSFSKRGLMGMTIHVGGYIDGVCLESYHMLVNTEQMLQAVIDDYEYAMKCGEKMMQLLKQNVT